MCRSPFTLPCSSLALLVFLAQACSPISLHPGACHLDALAAASLQRCFARQRPSVPCCTPPRQAFRHISCTSTSSSDMAAPLQHSGGGGWVSLNTPPEELCLANTLVTGQSFRWRRTDDASSPHDTYTGVIGQRLVQMRQLPGDVLYRVLARRCVWCRGVAGSCKGQGALHVLGLPGSSVATPAA